MSAITNSIKQYQRTEEGASEVVNKKHKLSARQRQFLLLIDKTDAFNQKICNQLSQAINIDQLIDLGLVSTANKVRNLVAKEAAATTQKTVSQNTARSGNKKTAAPKKETPVLLDLPTSYTDPESTDSANSITTEMLSVGEFSAIKETMVFALKRTSGLLAAELILKIEKAKTPVQLKQLTGIWRTTMLESRFNREQINTWFQQVKNSLGS